MEIYIQSTAHLLLTATGLNKIVSKARQKRDSLLNSLVNNY